MIISSQNKYNNRQQVGPNESSFKYRVIAHNTSFTFLTRDDNFVKFFHFVVDDIHIFNKQLRKKK